MLQIMNENGEIVSPELLPKWDDAALRSAYEKMVFMRMADSKMINLQRQGRCGSYISIEGQEAAQVGSSLTLEPKDWVFPAFRELGICYFHGVPLEKIMVYWMGNEWGSNYAANVAPVSIPVGSHLLHAVGMAWGMKLQNKKAMAVSFSGDGSTSEGDFYEAINFAGVLKTPTIFFIQNNQWAISTPFKRQTAAENIAVKAVAAGIRGVQVDGNDVFAVFHAMSEATERARNLNEPTLIEAVTYRFGNHSTSDDATKYRDHAEVKEWRKRDPIVRFRTFLQKKNLWTEAWQNETEERAKVEIEKAVTAAEAHPAPKPEEIFDYIYAKMTPELKAQKEYLLKSLNS